jgi:iron(III) transport system permease protein
LSVPASDTGLETRSARQAPRGASVRIDFATILAAFLIVVMAALVLPPLWSLVVGSLHKTTVTGATGDFTFDYYRRLPADRVFFRSLGNTLVFAGGSAVLAILCGGSIAWLVTRTNVPFKSLAYLTAIVSLGTPFVLYVAAWLFVLDHSGPLNDLLRAWSGGSVQFDVYSRLGMILIEGFLWSPMAFLLLAAVFGSANADYEDAARMCGAGLFQTLRRISLRLAFPGLCAVALLVVIRSIEAFEVPALVGLPGNVKVLTTDIFIDLERNVPPDFGHSSAFSIVLLGLAAILIVFYGRLSRHAARYHTVTGRAFRPRALDLGRFRAFGGVIVLANFVILLAVPMLGLLWLSLMPFSQTISRDGLSLLTLTNYANVLSTASYVPQVWQTLVIGAGGATGAMALMLGAGWLVARHRPGALAIDQLATVPLVFPGIVLGVAMMQIFLAAPVPLYGTLWAFVITFTIRFLPYGMRYASSGILQVHPELEESAIVAGASIVTVLRRVVVPLAAPSLLAGWLFIFLATTRDLSLAVMLASPSAQPVAVTMFDLWSNGEGPELAAFGLVWTAFMALLAALLYAIGRRSSSSLFET